MRTDDLTDLGLGRSRRAIQESLHVHNDPGPAVPALEALRLADHFLQRVGHTEAAVDLARLAGLYPAGVICEILNEDGSPARRPQLEEFAARHGLTFVTIAQLVAHRLSTEQLVHREAEARLPLRGDPDSAAPLRRANPGRSSMTWRR